LRIRPAHTTGCDFVLDIRGEELAVVVDGGIIGKYDCGLELWEVAHRETFTKVFNKIGILRCKIVFVKH
jgi:hypothetical protein